MFDVDNIQGETATVLLLSPACDSNNDTLEGIVTSFCQELAEEHTLTETAIADLCSAFNIPDAEWDTPQQPDSAEIADAYTAAFAGEMRSLVDYAALQAESDRVYVAQIGHSLGLEIPETSDALGLQGLGFDPDHTETRRCCAAYFGLMQVEIGKEVLGRAVDFVNSDPAMIERAQDIVDFVADPDREAAYFGACVLTAATGGIGRDFRYAANTVYDRALKGHENEISDMIVRDVFVDDTTDIRDRDELHQDALQTVVDNFYGLGNVYSVSEMTPASAGKIADLYLSLPSTDGDLSHAYLQQIASGAVKSLTGDEHTAYLRLLRVVDQVKGTFAENLSWDDMDEREEGSPEREGEHVFESGSEKEIVRAAAYLVVQAYPAWEQLESMVGEDQAVHDFAMESLGTGVGSYDRERISQPLGDFMSDVCATAWDRKHGCPGVSYIDDHTNTMIIE